MSHLQKKLYDWQVSKEFHEAILQRLIDDSFIDERRFSSAFVRGKFNQKKWGKIKITFELRSLNIDEQTINMALEEIDDLLYLEQLKSVYTAKFKSLKTEENTFNRQQKAAKYVISKGYETDLVFNTAKEITETLL